MELEGLLVMRRFIQRVMGSDVVDSIIGELAAVEALEESGAPSDSLFFADYEEASNSKTHRVHCLLKNPTTQKARNMASIWTMQDHPSSLRRVARNTHLYTAERCTGVFV